MLFISVILTALAFFAFHNKAKLLKKGIPNNTHQYSGSITAILGVFYLAFTVALRLKWIMFALKADIEIAFIWSDLLMLADLIIGFALAVDLYFRSVGHSTAGKPGLIAKQLKFYRFTRHLRWLCLALVAYAIYMGWAAPLY